MINHQQFCVIIGNVHNGRMRGGGEGGAGVVMWEGAAAGKKINHIILLWQCFIDLCWCSHISYLICIYWRAFRTMWAIWAMRENRAAFPSPELALMDRVDPAARWGEKRKEKKKTHAI